MKQTNKVRVAVVGCGAITRLYHMPVLAGHPGVEITALVDRNLEAARSLGEAYGIATIFDDAAQLRPDIAEAVLVAVPAVLHKPVCLPLMAAGFHVFVEKPMATTPADAEALAAGARTHGIVLSVGHFRRLFPSTRLTQALLASGEFGRVQRFTVEEGHILDWPSATLALMRRDLSGGGVLMDMGCHVLDQLLFMLPGDCEVLEYQDNSLGGIESDCRARVRIATAGGPIEGSVELSRTRRLKNVFTFACEAGDVESSIGDRRRVTVNRRKALNDQYRGADVPLIYSMEWGSQADIEAYAPFREQIDDWLQAIAGRRQPFLSAESAARVIHLIDAAYRARTPFVEPWVAEGVRDTVLAAAAAPAILKGAKPRVLVTGAAGFIGTRTCELLALREGYDVRALVHNPANASRVARLPVELAMGDIRRPEDVERAVQGCEAVVHAAYGTAWGDRAAIVATTVDGTVNLMRAANASGVKSFVHISTTAVHGTSPALGSSINPATPVHPDDDLYQQTKAQAERAIAGLTVAGAGATVLRLPNVYGPHSGPFTVRLIEHLRSGTPVLLDAGANPSNTIYVDNVVGAITGALRHPNAGPTPRVLVVADTERMTWAEFVRFHSDLLGVEPVRLTRDRLAALRATAAQPSMLSPSYNWRSLKALATAPESMAFAKRILAAEPLGNLPRSVVTAPAIKGRLQKLLKMDAPARYVLAADGGDPEVPIGLFDLYSIAAPVDVSGAADAIGYEPLVGRSRALELTAAWLRYSRLV